MIISSMLVIINMLHDSNEELVEWSILTQVRTIIENRRQELVNCLDNQKTVGLDKVLNRLFAQYGSSNQNMPQESDLVATPPTGGVFESDGTDGGTVGKFYVNVAMQDGAGNEISNLVDVSGLRKALISLSSRRTAAATAFDDARDVAAVQWSEAFKHEFLFE